MTHSKNVDSVYQKILTEGIKGSIGSMQFKLGKLAITLTTMDIIGGAIQDWFGEWLKANKINFSEPLNTQTFPDFILGSHDYLEVKCFNYEAGPAFDVANYGAYINSLLIHPERLDASYLIFGYSMKDGLIKIENIWLKKIWEITGPSPTNILEIQKKRGEPVNIRPKKWYSNQATVFHDRRKFIEALHKSALLFEYPNTHDESWLSKLEQKYESVLKRKI